MSVPSVSPRLAERPSASSSSPASTASAPNASTPPCPAPATRYEPPTVRLMALDGAPNTLRNEALSHRSANCLEQAARLARPGDSVLLFRDSQDFLGHAVVQHLDGSVVDPRTPSITYFDLGSWQATHPQSPPPQQVSVSALRQVLSLPPGPRRDAALFTLGKSRQATR